MPTRWKYRLRWWWGDVTWSAKIRARRRWLRLYRRVLHIPPPPPITLAEMDAAIRDVLIPGLRDGLNQPCALSRLLDREATV